VKIEVCGSYSSLSVRNFGRKRRLGSLGRRKDTSSC